MFKNSALFFWFVLSSTFVNAQAPIDTVKAELGNIVVVGYQGNRSILETPGSISYINPQTISGFDNSSLIYGMRTVAGVRMEERAPGSYRIAIRGSSLRSPFGIRNVKIYWNEIPLTEPTGSTFLNLLDPFNIQALEVIKGPGGSLYGAGNGGVLLINSTAPFQTDQLSMNSSLGSFGAFNYDLAYQDKVENGGLSFKYSKSETDGYREQSFLDRRVIEVSGKTEYASGREIAANILYSDLNYGIPGGLNEAQFQNDPTQARPGNPFVLGSVDANSSIKHESLLLGVTHTYQITEKFSNEASAFGTFSDFENPFNFDYKIDSRKSGGLRSNYAYETPLGAVKAKFTLGTEMQASSYAARNFGNDSGKVGELNFDDELKVKSNLIFLNTQLDLPNEWYFTAGISYNNLEYDINRLVATDGNGEKGLVEKNFDPQFIPRIGIAKKITPQITAHASAGLGFSPPTIEEIRTNEGSINLNLEAETGTNYELGLRGNAVEGKLGFDAVVFLFKLDDSIIQQANPDTTRDTFVFRNAGKTDQRGFELNANYLLIDNYSGFLRRGQLNLAYTYHDFEFGDYNTSDGDFSGNEMTGIPPHSLFSSLNIETAPGLYAHLSYTFTDEIPLEDDNSVYSNSYQLVQAKIGFRITFLDDFKADLYFGIDNLLDEKYSLGYDINAFGGRYFQPAPERNWFIGVKLICNI
ncbi:MAG: TonB-dependent receptor [Balneolaceae bacterium]|nr:TonB-dependent receptor [Balneolaceae bacterium]MBO6544805.1 TonB-dependent receptor [Balneolaceae bacterium]MBO6646201.1 TonB-dependent receptor [Balneolaceae bacterium]